VVLTGNYTGPTAKTFVVEVVTPGEVGTATFKWSNNGGDTFTADGSTSGTAVPLSDGLKVQFAGTNFKSGNSWTVYASPSRNQPVWIDLYVPEATVAGTYRGKVTVTADGESPVAIPVTLEVYNFSLPVTSSLPNYFGMSWYDLGSGHYGTAQNGTILLALGSAYLKSGLRHRLSYSIQSSPSIPLFTYNSDGTIATANYSNFDAFASSFMNGIDMPKGAKLTSIALPRDPHGAGTDPIKKLNALRDIIQHIKAKPFCKSDRLFDYSWDEPSSLDYAKVKERTELIKRADPTVRRLVTTPLVADLIGNVTRWTPNMLSLIAHPTQVARGVSFPDPSIYNARKALGEQVWWYQACGNVGCYTEGQEYTQGWPNFAIEYSPMTNRVFQWMTYKYRMQGEVYFTVDYAYGRYGTMNGVKVELAESLLYFGANGDGTLYYPGRPAEIGGTMHIPLESIRLKLIREGYEDYEYLRAARRASGSDTLIDAKVNSLITNTFTWKDDPTLLYQLRQELAEIAVSTSRIEPPEPPNCLTVK
jgi:hypothetical protein